MNGRVSGVSLASLPHPPFFYVGSIRKRSIVDGLRLEAIPF